MRTRQELKALGRERFMENRWNCVLAVLLVSAVLGAISWISGGTNVRQVIQGDHRVVTVSTRSGVGSLLSILLTGPINIGLSFFFIRNFLRQRDDLTVTTPFTEAFNNYPRKLGGTLWEALFVFLWSLLLVIPGIIKAISYSMTKYILADCPNVGAKNALKLSMRMTEGHKMEIFVLELSFLGWLILSALTLGILHVLFVGPYMESTMAAYYLELRTNALRTGAVTVDQLNGGPLY